MDYLTTDAEITSIANALRTAANISRQLEYPTEFVSVLNSGILVDLSGDTVSPSNLLEGVTAHNSLGAPIIGTMTQEEITVSGGTVSKISGTDNDYLLTLT